jgi:digeranylgeranylglycerophospholipid reductase
MGGELRTGITSTEPISEEKVEGIKINGKEIVKARYFVDATGVCQNIWRNVVDFAEPLDPKEIEVCFQYKVEDSKIQDHDLIQLFFGNEVAPGGYAWVFPKDSKRANVGLGCQASRVKSAFPFMQKLWDDLKLDGKIVSKKGGTVSGYPIPDKIVWSNLACVGSSARLTNPIHGGGTGPALFGGYILGKHIADDMDSDIPEEKTLKKYQDELKEKIGDKHKNHYRLKVLFQDLSDEEMTKVLKSISEDEWKNIMDLSKTDMLKIVARIAKKDMKLGMKIPKYLKV